MAEHTQGLLAFPNDGRLGHIEAVTDHSDVAMTQMRVGLGRPDPEREANARRIVAAWNACAGISTAALEAGVVAKLVEACGLMLPMLEHLEKCEASADDVLGDNLRKLRRGLDAARAALELARQE